MDEDEKQGVELIGRGGLYLSIALRKTKIFSFSIRHKVKKHTTRSRIQNGLGHISGSCWDF